MAINLRSGEEIKSELKIYTSRFPIAWALFGCVVLISALASAAFDSPKRSQFEPASVIPISLMFFGPLLYIYLRNRSTSYLVTNERIYIEEGILAKRKRDIPLSKINDIEIRQGFFERQKGVGKLFVYTGSPKALVLHNIVGVEHFRETVSELIGPRKTA